MSMKYCMLGLFQAKVILFYQITLEMKRMSDWHDLPHFKKAFYSLNNQKSKLPIVNIESEIWDTLLFTTQA